MFDHLIDPNPTINFEKLVSHIFPDGVPAPTPGYGYGDYRDLVDQIIQTMSELTYGDNTWYCDVYAFLSMMVRYLREDDKWVDANIEQIYNVITELAESGSIHLIDLSH